MSHTLPRRQPRTPEPTGLFPDVVASIEPAGRGKRTTSVAREFVHVTEHVVLYIESGKAGAESPLKTACWESMEHWARTRLAELDRDAEFLRRWLTLERKTEVELRA